jgi:hypothetical protein
VIELVVFLVHIWEVLALNIRSGAGDTDLRVLVALLSPSGKYWGKISSQAITASCPYPLHIFIHCLFFII